MPPLLLTLSLLFVREHVTAGHAAGKSMLQNATVAQSWSLLPQVRQFACCNQGRSHHDALLARCAGPRVSSLVLLVGRRGPVAVLPRLLACISLHHSLVCYQSYTALLWCAQQGQLTPAILQHHVFRCNRVPPVLDVLQLMLACVGCDAAASPHGAPLDLRS